MGGGGSRYRKAGVPTTVPETRSESDFFSECRSSGHRTGEALCVISVICILAFSSQVGAEARLTISI